MLTPLLLLVAAVWLAISYLAIRNVLATRPLPERDILPSLPPPQVSVILAARDEEARIEETVRRLLAQQGVELELIAVDDRSRDRTREILQELAVHDERLRRVRVDELPPGWLGKCHACWRGAALARGDWLLFTDADVHMQPDLIERAIATAVRDEADHLVLWPGLACSSWLARGAVLGWAQCLSLYAPAAQINADRGKRGLGVGAFNLVRAEAYRAIGGHEPLALEVIDDVKLGLLLRRAGFRQRIYSGARLMEAEWAGSLRQAVRAVEKNWFAAMQFNLARGVAALVLITTLWLAAATGPWLEPWAGSLALAALLGQIVPGLLQVRQIGWPWHVALAVPVGMPLFVVAGLHSTWTAVRQGGIRWRDTFYPLAQLRAGLVR